MLWKFNFQNIYFIKNFNKIIFDLRIYNKYNNNIFMFKNYKFKHKNIKFKLYI